MERLNQLFRLYRRRQRRRGYTMVEIMIVVVILGVLAAVAIPASERYIRRAKTSEASDKLSLIYRGAVGYFIDANTNVKQGVGGAGIPLTFPENTGKTPGVKCCSEPGGGLCLTDSVVWDTPTWQALNFSISDPFRYNYSFYKAGVGPGANFTARANGDLDCDDIESTFERCGLVTDTLDVASARGIYMRSPWE